MAITVPPVRGAGDLGHVDDSNVVRQALLDLDAAGSAHYPAKGDVHGFRWDETVGRRLFAWDQVNNREQMIYGDTGWRLLDAALLNGWTATVSGVKLRRVGAAVYLEANIDKTSATADSFYTLPSGFRCDPLIYGLARQNGGLSAVRYNIDAAGGCLAVRSEITTFANIAATWLTVDAWPTSLPGTALGGIPTGLVMDTAELLPAGGQ